MYVRKEKNEGRGSNAPLELVDLDSKFSWMSGRREKKWGHRGSNAGPLELQSTALPTELCPLLFSLLIANNTVKLLGFITFIAVSDPTISHSDLLPDIFRSECQVQEPEKISSRRAWR
jgi:hypothetical protein